MNLIKHLMKFFNCAILLLIVVMNPMPNMAQQRYCGSTLRDALDALCVNGFNPMPLSKRSDPSTNLIDNTGLYKMNRFNSHDRKQDRDNDLDRVAAIIDVANEIENENDDIFPHGYDSTDFLHKIFNSDVANFLTKTRRRRHGIYEECCRKPCHVNELADYCL